MTTPDNDDSAHMATAASMVVSLIAYLCSLGTLLWLIVFLVPSDVLPTAIFDLIPNTLDSAPFADTWVAVASDLLLLSNFGFLHSLLARASVKKWMGIDPRFERSFFLLQTAVSLSCQMYFWRNFEGPDLWNTLEAKGFFAQSSVSNILVGVYLFGVFMLVSSTFALDHFHLFGLSQGFGIDLNAALGLALNRDETASSAMVVRWHYKYIAHPIMVRPTVLLTFLFFGNTLY